MQQSNFEKVITFNRIYGTLKEDTLKPKLNIFDQDPQEVENCLKLVREEVRELEDDVKSKNFVKTADSLADILYVVYGMAARLGIDADLVFNMVHENNMSKICKTEEEAQQSVKYYEDNKEKLGYDSPSYRQAPDNVNWVVYNKSTNKVLKSIKWKDVDLTFLMDQS